MSSLPPILPTGTQVVSHIDITNSAGDVTFAAGAVGVIIKAPVDATHAYRVRFMDGTEQSLKRGQFSVRSHHQNPTAPDDHLAGIDLYQHVVYRCVVGSRAYGLDHEESDTDLRGIYLPPADLQWSLFGVPEQLERGEEAYWEMQKFIVLALKANPNILECLYTPLVEHAAPIAKELLDQRHIFMSKLIYQTYNGYVMSQFRKLQKDIENHGEIRWKHAMHLIRLLLSGIIALREGVIPVRVPDEYRMRLLAIRHGETPWEDVNAWRLVLHKEFDAAFQTTTLPERPDYEAANAYLLRARKYAHHFNLPHRSLSELNFDYDRFQSALLNASHKAFQEIRSKHNDETFYAYGLYHEPLWGYIIPVANTEEGLYRRAMALKEGRHRKLFEGSSLTDIIKEIRWSPGDWAYFDIARDQFADVHDILHEAPDLPGLFYDKEHNDRMISICRSVLNQLNAEGVFGGWDERMRVVLNIMMGDQDASWIEHAKLLNPGKVYYRWLNEIQEGGRW